MDRKQKVVIVDEQSKELESFLVRCGFEVVYMTPSGTSILAQINYLNADLIVLDVSLPQANGRELVRKMRQDDNWTPIILLTHAGLASERIIALEEGADDYITKPFDPHELLARIHAILRRTQSHSVSSRPTRLKSGALTLDCAGRRVWLESKELSLTPKAIGVLEYLMTHADMLITREQLLDTLWGWDSAAGTRAVDARIAELRRAFKTSLKDSQYIETVFGQGYRFIGHIEIMASSQAAAYSY